MPSLFTYSIFDAETWAEAMDSLTRAIHRAAGGRNQPCPCGSGKKYKKCHGGADAELPLEQWLDTGGELRLGNAVGIDRELAQQANHVARLQRAARLFGGARDLDVLGPRPLASDLAAAAAVLREETGGDEELQEILSRLLDMAPDYQLDYQRIVFDLVEICQTSGNLEPAIRAQKWWIEFLEDFGEFFFLRVEAINKLYDLLLKAGEIVDSADSKKALRQRFATSKARDRSWVMDKLKRGEPPPDSSS